MATERTEFQIVVAEDNSADVGLVREALKEHGINCSLHVLTDGAQAIAFIHSLDANPQDRPIDLLLLDMHLPKRDGDDILKCLRSTEHYAELPVIVMTGSDSSVFEEQATKHAAISYFQKTSDLDGFLRLGLLVRKILTGSGEEHARGAA
jgi:CheY-like chemotaxis protein